MSEAVSHPETPAAHGVDVLIGRLRDQGVAAGREQAAKILAEAEARAGTLIAEAEATARRLVEDARAAAAREQAAARDALYLAGRDAVLAMKRTLSERFAGAIGGLVSDQMRDPELLRRLILIVAARSRDGVTPDEAETMEILLPEDAVGLEQLRRDPEQLNGSDLTRLVLAVTGDLLRAGVEFRPGVPGERGLRVMLRGETVELDLSDRAVAAVLMEHLQPRFRALLEGMVK